MSEFRIETLEVPDRVRRQVEQLQATLQDIHDAANLIGPSQPHGSAERLKKIRLILRDTR